MATRKQIHIAIDDAVIVPSLASNLFEDLKSAANFILTVKIYVEEP
jgi:hypothetical protein